MASPIRNSSDTSSLSAYAIDVSDTDILNRLDVSPILQGLYGEVGGIMSTSKKHIREGSAYPGYKRAAEEEFGDTLWYLAALCRRLNISLDELFTEAAKGRSAAKSISTDSVDKTLFQLGRSAAALMVCKPDRTTVVAFAIAYLDALDATQLVLEDVAQGNLLKARGAFLDPKPEDLIDFDCDFGVEEQLPRQFEIRVNQRESGRSHLQWNGVFIGDPLTDNIGDPDGYRFHDAFHFAYAAILHWSPVMRALIKQKRKSSHKYDETEDGGRAIVVEEGLTAWIFTRAKELNFFEGQDRISLGLLKNIGEFVFGYEVSKCPLKLWERAILEGYAVFRQIRDANGGWIIGNRTMRTIQYASLESKK